MNGLTWAESFSSEASKSVVITMTGTSLLAQSKATIAGISSSNAMPTEIAAPSHTFTQLVRYVASGSGVNNSAVSSMSTASASSVIRQSAIHCESMQLNGLKSSHDNEKIVATSARTVVCLRVSYLLVAFRNLEKRCMLIRSDIIALICIFVVLFTYFRNNLFLDNLMTHGIIHKINVAECCSRHKILSQHEAIFTLLYKTA